MSAPDPATVSADTPATVDLSALSWVQDEVRRSLEAAHKALHRHLREAESLRGSDVDRVDPSVLRGARVHIHQAAGALELVGMRVPGLFLRASERAVFRLAERPSMVTAESVASIERASFALVDYLGRLTAGKQLSGVALFPQYRSLLELAGVDRIHPADLWEHDWRWRVIGREPGISAQSVDPQTREIMERLILRLMRTPDRTTLRRMSDLCAALGADAKGRRATMWRVAAGFFEAQAAGRLVYDVYVKRAAPRLLAQMRLGLRSGDVSDRLAHDLLFFCARANIGRIDPALPRLNAVLQAYGLENSWVPDYEAPALGRFDPSWVVTARKRVAAAREAWSGVSAGEAHRLHALNESFPLLQDSLEKLYPNGQDLGHALVRASEVVGPAGVPPGLAMEVATAILYLEASLEDGDLDEPGLGERVHRLAQRIDSARRGAEPLPLDAWMEELYRRVSDNQTMGSVVQELRGSLSEIEKQIDQYFRQPGQRDLLFPVPGQLSSMRGVLSVLGLESATQAILRMRDDVDQLAHGGNGPDEEIRAQHLFERLADNLGALSFMIDMLAVQPTLAKALFRFDPDTGLLRALMGQPSREPAFADSIPDTGPGDLGERTLLVSRDALSGTVGDEEFARDLRSLAQQAMLAEQRRLADTLTAAQAALAATTEPEQRRVLRAELAGKLQQLAAGSEVAPAGGSGVAMPARVADAERVMPDPAASDFGALPVLDAPALEAEPAPLPDAPVSHRDAPRDESREPAASTVAEVPAAEVPTSAIEVTAGSIDVTQAEPSLTDASTQVSPQAPEVASMPTAVAAEAPSAPDALDVSVASVASDGPPLATPLPELSADDAEMLEVFLEEADEVFADARAAMDRLAQDDRDLAGDLSEITAIRRAFHTLKGSSRMVGLGEFGEAAWACEQLYNSRLARTPTEMEPLLRGLTLEALAYLDAWAQAIRERMDRGHRAAPVAVAAEALRLSGTRLPILLPGQSPVPVAESPPAAVGEVPPTDASVGEEAAPDIIAAAPLPLELDAEAEPASMAPADADLPVADVSSEPEPGVGERTLVLPPAAADTELPLAAAFSFPDIELDLRLDDAVDIPVDNLGDKSGDNPVDIPWDIPVENVPAAPVAAVPALPALELDFDLDLNVPPLPARLADEPLAVAPADLAATGSQEDTVASTPALPEGADALEEQIKVIGPLRIDIAMFNIFLNEADELSRRLSMRLGEWAFEADGPPGDGAVVMAHSLAGSSATVGFAELSMLARALEYALMRSNLSLEPVGAEAALFNEAADDIRRMLHQFAAGFLVKPRAGLVEQLEQHQPPSSELLAFGAEPLAAGPADAATAAHPDASDTADAVEIEADAVSAPDTQDEVGPEIAPADGADAAADAAAKAPALAQAEAQAGEQAQVEITETTGASETAEPDAASTPAAPVAEATATRGPAQPDGRVSSPDAAPAAEPIAAQRAEPAETSAAGVSAATAAVLAVASAARLLPTSHRWVEDDDIDQQDSIDSDLFPIFSEEAQELLPQLQSRTRDWLTRPGDRQAAAACMRTLHTFKGGARLAGAMRVGEMAHRLETAIEQLLVRPTITEPDIEPLLGRVDALEAAFHALQDALAAAEDDVVPAGHLPADSFLDEATVTLPASDAPAAAHGVGIDWTRFAAFEAASPAATGERIASGTASLGAVRVRATLLDRLVNHAGEVSIARTRLESDLGQVKGSLTDLSENLERLRRQLRDVEVQAESQISSRLEAAKAASVEFDPLEMDRYTRVQELTRMMAESVNDVATVQRSLQRALQSSEDQLATQARLTRSLQDDLLRTRMVEFESLSDRLYRVVRQAAKETGKQVRLDIVGGSIDIDRSVLERMTAPFEHLLRNSITHGIELPAVRVAKGKDPVGHIEIRLAPEGNEVAIDFSDDGAGLDLARIAQRARSLGLLAADETPGDERLADLIFTPGFSTAERVTELAGRGVGMDVVRSEVLALGGRVQTHKVSGGGTRFRLVMPLTTAVTQVVMLRCGTLRVAVPSNLVEIVRREPAHSLEQAYRLGTWPHGGESLPFHWLGALLGGEPVGAATARTVQVVIVRSAAQRVALHVDEVIGNQEVVVKNLGPQLTRLPGLSGMTLLASGAVTAIYNPVALDAWYGAAARQRVQRLLVTQSASSLSVVHQPALPPAPLVLVVDDSLTVRRVTQRLLVREGYRVVTAKDGLDALERIGEERPRVILSDIEMPRMDGFDFVRNLRADPELAQLPVIMITSRIAPKHRDYALELGVRYYLGKPYREEELLAQVARFAHTEAAPA